MTTAYAPAILVATDLRVAPLDAPMERPIDLARDGTVYRPLDARFYAWLRRRMDRAKRAHDAGKLPAATWATLRGRFNEVHEWAVEHLGEVALVDAVEHLDERTYVAPAPAARAPENSPERDSVRLAAAERLAMITPENIESFKALGIRVGIQSPAGDFTLVPSYTGDDPVEISIEDAARIAMVIRTFPGSRIVGIGPDDGSWEGDAAADLPRSSLPVPARPTSQPTASRPQSPAPDPRQESLF